MTKDIWAEKPEKGHGVRLNYSAMDMDPWLAELKAEYEERDRVYQIIHEYWGEVDCVTEGVLFSLAEETLEKSDKLEELLTIYKRHYSNLIEYAVKLQEKAEKWDTYEGLGFLPAELMARLVRFFDELRSYASENTQMQIKAEMFYQELIPIENPLKIYEKLEAIRKLKDELDEAIDFHVRASRTHGTIDTQTARHEMQKRISDRLGQILGGDE